jgi:hypothetical protein
MKPSLRNPLVLATVLAGILLIGVAAAGPRLASRPAPAGQRAAAAPPTKFVLKVPVPSLPATAGAVTSFNGELVDPADTTKRLGEVDGVCGLAKLVGGAPTLLCHGVFVIDGQGQLYMAGTWPVQTTYPYTLPPTVISGGTGAYRADLGEADFTGTGVGTLLLTLHLVPPAPTPSPGT